MAALVAKPVEAPVEDGAKPVEAAATDVAPVRVKPPLGATYEDGAEATLVDATVARVLELAAAVVTGATKVAAADELEAAV
ncbi:hypothetical protein LTR65_004257 [Meristemomyces frigidus]